MSGCMLGLAKEDEMKTTLVKEKQQQEQALAIHPNIHQV